MIEECARVVATGEGCAWVETQRQTTCGACSVKTGCGTAALAKAFRKRRAPVYVLSAMPLQIGDQVIIGIAEQALIKGSVAVYLVPLLTMLLGAGLGRLMFLPANEAISIVLGITGLAGGLLWLRFFSQTIRADSLFQPMVLQRFTL